MSPVTHNLGTIDMIQTPNAPMGNNKNTLYQNCQNRHILVP